MNGRLRRRNITRKWMLVLVTGCLLLLLAGCGNGTADVGIEDSVDNSANQSTAQTGIENEDNPLVTITLENGKQIEIELYPEIAPNTVANFIALIEDGFYDGLIFHRVIPGFMIQGGDPEGTGMGGPGYGISGEFRSNGFTNDLTHERGVISMARANDPDSAGSQFFIVVEESPFLDGDYAAFGKVIEGMDAVDEIVAVERDHVNKPLEDQSMQTVEVDTKGIDYPEPEKVN